MPKGLNDQNRKFGLFLSTGKPQKGFDACAIFIEVGFAEVGKRLKYGTHWMRLKSRVDSE